DKLAKFKDKSILMKSKMKIFEPMELDATMESSVAGEKFRHVLQLNVMGMDISQTIVYDGKEMWIALNGKVIMTLNKEDDLKAIKEMIYAEKMAGMAFLGGKKVELAIIGEDKVNDTPVVGVRVSSKDHKDINLYFDKETGMLAKMNSQGLDFQTQQEVAEERI